ncbi:MAG: glycosyltransferase [Dehalococcoidia bacterium]
MSEAVESLVHWVVYGDPVAQALLCVTLLVVVRDALAIGYRCGRDAPARDFPPVSILKPLHGDEPDAETALRSFCLLTYPAPYEVIFVLEDEGQPLHRLAQALSQEFPDRVTCLLSGPATDHLVNGKSHNLAAAAAVAKFALLLISDSDTVADPLLLQRLVVPLRDGRVAAVAAIPRVTVACSAPARIERLLVNAVLGPFQYASAQVRGASGLWGTLLLVRRPAIDGAGGFRELGRYLTEDIALEDGLRRQELRGALVRVPVNVLCGQMNWRQLLRHWHRWLVGLRRMRPFNHACMGLILLAYLMPLGALIAFVVSRGATDTRLTALALFVLAQLLSLFILGRAGIGIREPTGSYALLPIAIAVLLYAYAWSFIDTTVTWRGRRLRIGRDGRIRF